MNQTLNLLVSFRADVEDADETIAERVYHRATAAVPERQRAGSSRYRRPLVVAVAAVVLLTASGFSSAVRSLLGLKPSRPIAAQATLLVTAPIGNGFVVHEWSSPSSSGGTCLYTSISAIRAPAPPTMNGGGSCSTSGGTGIVTSAQHPIAASISLTRRPSGKFAPNWAPPIVAGEIWQGLHATRLRVEWEGGSFPLVVQGRYFAGGSPKLYQPSPAAFPFRIVAYDPAGHVVAQTRLPRPALLFK